MKKPVALPLAALAVAVLACVAALIFLSSRQPDSVDSTEARPPISQTAPASNGHASVGGDTSAASLETVKAEPLAAPANAAAALAPTRSTPAGEESVEPTQGDREAPAALTDDEIAAAIKEKGGVIPAYVAAAPDHRADFIDFLSEGESLRESLPGLLALETDSDLRARMIEATVPEGYFDEAIAVAGGATPLPETGATGDSPEPSLPTPVIDTQLQALLDQAPLTPMKADEWIARLDLAAITDDAYGLSWVRKARDNAPADAPVQALASSYLLSFAQDDRLDVTEDEQQWAVQTLCGALVADSLNSDQRIQAYYALFSAPDRGQAREFLAGQRNEESDPVVRQTLDQLLDRWDGKLTSPPTPEGHEK